MRGRGLLFAWTVIVGWPSASLAVLDVDPARPITHRVTVQIIETAHDNGTPATIFGDATQRASIEAGIDMIWAQAGIDIAWVPNIIRYTNTFAYQGTNSTRPTSDLGRIMDNATAAGKINTTTLVINMFFVNVVPGFSFTSESTANGIANVGDDGIAAFAGDSLLTFQNGQDVIAKVMAHEIGHNLGLEHEAAGGPNLMSSNGTAQKLTVEQINTVFQSTSFPQPLFTIPLGDYNRDGTVNAADYAVWRNTNGTTSDLSADGNRNGRIDNGDYTIWRSNFGATGGSGQALPASTPEPATWTGLLAALVALASSRTMRSLDRQRVRHDRPRSRPIGP